MTRSIAIVGGGIAGLAAAYELQRMQHRGADLTYTLFEQSPRLGGIVETIRKDGFILEGGPDGWVTEKPWARELAEELGLADELIPSNDADRVTWILQHGTLQAMPDNMRMMVPEDVHSILDSSLFSESARSAYLTEESRADELRVAAPMRDESVASFVRRHFGDEVLRVIGAPLLGGVFGGDVHKLSVQSVMMPFVHMEREHGSLIRALALRKAQRGTQPRPAIFTSLRSGTDRLAERVAASLNPTCIRISTSVQSIRRTGSGWLVNNEPFQHLMLATPVDVTTHLLRETDTELARLLQMPASSAVIAAFGFTAIDAPALPKGFGFLAPEDEACALLAATFADQKFADRVPPGGKSLRAYFGGATADAIMSMPDDQITHTALRELASVLGPLPRPSVTVVRRWPRALPQYEIGHLERMAAAQQHVDRIGALHLLGNGYRGVGLPDLIRDGRAAARSLLTI